MPDDGVRLNLWRRDLILVTSDAGPDLDMPDDQVDPDPPHERLAYDTVS